MMIDVALSLKVKVIPIGVRKMKCEVVYKGKKDGMHHYEVYSPYSEIPAGPYLNKNKAEAKREATSDAKGMDRCHKANRDIFRLKEAKKTWLKDS